MATNATHSTADISDPYIPITTMVDQSSRTVTRRPSRALYTLFETGEYFQRTGLFQPLIHHRAVALSNGKLAIDKMRNASRSRICSADVGPLSEVVVLVIAHRLCYFSSKSDHVHDLYVL